MIQTDAPKVPTALAVPTVLTVMPYRWNFKYGAVLYCRTIPHWAPSNTSPYRLMLLAVHACTTNKKKFNSLNGIARILQFLGRPGVLSFKQKPKPRDLGLQQRRCRKHARHRHKLLTWDTFTTSLLVPLGGVRCCGRSFCQRCSCTPAALPSLVPDQQSASVTSKTPR